MTSAHNFASENGKKRLFIRMPYVTLECESENEFLQLKYRDFVIYLVFNFIYSFNKEYCIFLGRMKINK